MKQKLIALTLAVTMLLTGTISAVAGSPEGAYKDVKEKDWFFPAVSAIGEAVAGYPDGTFRPGNVVTFGEFIAMVVKATVTDEIQQIQGQHWAKPYYKKAIQKGYFTYAEIPDFVFDQPIDRSYMAFISAGVLGKEKGKIEGFDKLEYSLSDLNSETFNEYEIIQSYAEGILAGYPDGTFRPDATLTRGAAASVIWKLKDPTQRKVPNIEMLPNKPLPSKLTQDEKILEILEGGLAPIDFDPVKDVTKNVNGRVAMKEAKAVEYMDRILASLKFYGEKGKYYMAVTFPEVPEGYQIAFGADISYKLSLMKPKWVVRTWSPREENRIAKVGTVTREIKGLSSLSQLSDVTIGFSINHIDETDQGSEIASYTLQENFKGGFFGINRVNSIDLTDSEIPYNISRHFTWK